MLEASNVELMLLRAEKLLERGDHEAADAICARLLGLNHEHDVPKCYEMHLHFGDVLVKCKNLEQATVQYQAAVAANPESWLAFVNLGYTLFTCGKHGEAIPNYQRAIAIVENATADANNREALAYAHYGWGNALYEQGLYDEALDHWSITAEEPNRFRTYSLHNKAECLFKLGLYRDAWEIWQKVLEEYGKTPEEAKNPNYFSNYGRLLYEMFGDPAAEDILKKGLQRDRKHVNIHATLVNLYRERSETDSRMRTNYYVLAKRHFNQAIGELKAHDDPHSLVQLGNLSLSMDQYDEAESYLSRALENEQDTAQVHTALGVLYSRREDWKKAKKHFERAVHHDFDNLKAHSNLAEVLYRSGDRERAEAEFTSILAIAPGHIESHIGLGEIYKDMADAGEDDMYSTSLHHFSEVFDLVRRREGSKRLRRREAAAVHYSMGYVRAGIYQASKQGRDRRALRRALQDFRNALQDHPEDAKTQRALHRIQDELHSGSVQRAAERWGSGLIAVFAAFTFLMAQTAFILDKPPVNLGVGYFILLTFGSLIFIVAGLSLPQLLKLKVGTVELEKQSVQQTDAQVNLSLEK